MISEAPKYKVNEKLKTRLESLSISKTQKAIRYLEKQPELSINQVAEIFGISHQTISRALRKLEAEQMGVCPECGQKLPRSK